MEVSQGRGIALVEIANSDRLTRDVTKCGMSE
jgi:hypothetical protein